MLEHILLKTHLKNIYLMAKPGEKKSNFAKTVMDMDQLTMTILKEHNGLNRKSDGLLLKPGKQISEEIHTLNTDSAFCCLPLIADAIIQNMDKRLKDELGLTMFDPKISYAIRGRISFLGIGSGLYPASHFPKYRKTQCRINTKAINTAKFTFPTRRQTEIIFFAYCNLPTKTPKLQNPQSILKTTSNHFILY